MANGQIDVIVAKKAIEELNKALKGVDAINASIIKLSKSVRELNTTFSQVKTPKGLEARLNKNAAAQKKVKDNVEKVRLAEIRLQQQREKAFDKFTAGLERQRKARLREADAIDRNKKALDRQRQAALRNNTAFGRLNKTFGRFAAALGLTSGIFLFIRAIRNTTRRIREFDKSIVGLSAILKINRKDLKNLEETIKNVAGSSIKTSNEVADLATKLATLGKTRREIIKLLKPVNDLSIALEATSEEAGELLVQTLNAFGKSSDSAQEFADIIANMRTSTALDFERIKDALGFLAPTARAAGISFEKTGAILGTLVDNGIKAARAGRLTSTAFLKLAKDGKSLEDALDEINAAQEKNVTNLELLKLAGDLFGARAAALGLILADNRDKVAELTEEFENSKDSLKELTEKQLESLDAQLKILDSTWEKFILNVENGNGVLASFFKNIIIGTGRVISAIDNVSQVSTGFGDFFLNIFRLSQQGGAVAIATEAEFAALEKQRLRIAEEAFQILIKTTDADAARALVNSLNIDQLNELIEAQSTLNEEEKEAIEINEELNTTIKGSVGFLNEIIAANNKLILQATDRTTIAKLQEENRLLEQQKKLLLEGPRQAVSAIQTVAAGPTGIDPTLAGTTLEQEKISISPFQLALDEITTFVDKYDEEINKAIDITNAFFDNRIERIQQDIDANNEFFANQIALAEGNEEQQRRLEQERQIKDAELQKKKQKELEKQAIFNKAIATTSIIIDTAKAVVAALPNIPLSIAAGVLGAAQLATVLATPIPKFAEGTESAPKGLAIVGDAGKHEYVETPKGIFETPATDTVVNLKGSETIHKDLDSLIVSKGYDLDAINKAAVMTSIFNDGERLNSLQLANVFSDSLNKFNSKIEKKLERGIKQGFKGVKINTNTNFDHSIYRQEML